MARAPNAAGVEVIREAIRVAVADQLPQEEIERRVLAGRSERYEALALDLLESYRLDNTPELSRVVEVILQYPPALPRGAKRMLNQARLLTQIARERGIFGGHPELPGAPRRVDRAGGALAADRPASDGEPRPDGGARVRCGP